MDWAAKGSKKKKHQEKIQTIKESLASPEIKLLIARKDFTICQNEFFLKIKVGDNLINVPERFLQNLITEGVLDKDAF